MNNTTPPAARKRAAPKATAKAALPQADALAASAPAIADPTPAAPAPVAKTGTAKAAKPAKAPKIAKPAEKPAKTEKPAKAEKAEKAAKPAKIKLVRDSFTMPEGDYANMSLLKQRCLKEGVAAKKSELLRLGLSVLAALPATELARQIAALEKLKTGRPAQS